MNENDTDATDKQPAKNARVTAAEKKEPEEKILYTVSGRRNDLGIFGLLQSGIVLEE